jgi:hypothetical protein
MYPKNCGRTAANCSPGHIGWEARAVTVMRITDRCDMGNVTPRKEVESGRGKRGTNPERFVERLTSTHFATRLVILLINP